VINSPMHFHQT